MTNLPPHMPPGWPITHPRRHTGPRPALAGVMAIGGTVVILALLAVLVGLVIWVARIGGNW